MKRILLTLVLVVILNNCANTLSMGLNENGIMTCEGKNTKGDCERWYDDNGTITHEKMTMSQEPALGPITSLLYKLLSALAWPIRADMD